MTEFILIKSLCVCRNLACFVLLFWFVFFAYGDHLFIHPSVILSVFYVCVVCLCSFFFFVFFLYLVCGKFAFLCLLTFWSFVTLAIIRLTDLKVPDYMGAWPLNRSFSNHAIWTLSYLWARYSLATMLPHKGKESKSNALKSKLCVGYCPLVQDTFSVAAWPSCQLQTPSLILLTSILSQ